MLKIPGLKPNGNRLGFPCGSAVKNQSVMQETQQESQVQSLGQEDLLEKEIATHSNMLAWKIPCPEKPGGQAACSPWGPCSPLDQRVGQDGAPMHAFEN